LPNDSTASTGDFELIYQCFIERSNNPQIQKIQLNVDGKKIRPPVRKPREFIPFKNFADLVIQGEKLFNPLKIRCRPKFVTTRMAKTSESDSSESEEKKKKVVKKSFKPTKLYRSPKKPRNIFQNIVVKPYSNNIVSYVKKLPSILQSSNRRIVNLNDLMRYLKID
jgi:hypothetical protein